ncbi:MAG: SDR family oxidoreductase [Anaerolineae bacterium]|nr:SDR family oxidoreductase [Anaerolineae bacterium]
MDLRLKDKVVLVTAASRGLGYATAYALAQEGANIALCARNEAQLTPAAQRLADETGVEVLPIVADVADANAGDRLAAMTLENFGRIDALFINAGGPPPGKFLDLRANDWDAAINLTIQSAVRLAYAVIPVMRQQNEGSLLFNTSVTVKHPLDNLILSNSLRLAIVGLVKSLSIELGPNNIRVNAIGPGWTRTERVDQLLGDRAARNGTTPEAEAEKIAAAIPLGRIAEPEEYGRVAAFLLSPAASYVTGVTLLVDGGLSRAVM